MCLSEHDNCADYLLRIEDFLEGKFTENLIWMEEKNIKEVLELKEKYGLKGDNEELLKIFEGLISKEFDNIIKNFAQKANEAKEHMLLNAKQLFSTPQFDLKLFKEKLDSLYNIDTFKTIFESSEKEESNFEEINNELNKLFKQATDKTNIEELQEIARTINAFTRNLVEIDERLFTEFKKNIPFQMFDGYPRVMKMLSWDPVRKSNKITLGNDNMNAQKIFYSTWDTRGDTAIVGSRPMSRGLHKWILEVHTQVTQPGTPKESHWICFGVIEDQFVKDAEHFSYRKALGLSSLGEVYNAKLVNKLEDYDDKIYVCNLDMEEGTFTISYRGTIIAQQSSRLKGKSVVPFAYLHRGNNCVKLRGFITP